MSTVYLYLGTFAAFLAIDAVWLGLVAPKFYSGQIGHLMAPSPNLPAAGIFYAIYVVGVLVFAVLPADGVGPMRAVALGALFGFIAYATYDLTNLATLRDWPILVTVVDLAWGTFLTGSVALVGYYISQWLAR